MTLLSRYILRQNLFLLFLLCGVGLGVYVFIDLFDRLDDFLEAGVGLGVIAAYYAYRLPFILAQIFPAVFLLALLVQLGLMLRNRELLALEACSVSLGRVCNTILGYALILCAVQFLFSEGLGAGGHKAAERIWTEEVRNRQASSRRLTDIWFREGNQIVHMAGVTPAEKTGTNLTVYVFDPQNGGVVQEVIRARNFNATEKGWALQAVTKIDPKAFSSVEVEAMLLDLRTDVQSFLVIDPKAKLESLPFWQLGREIDRLQESGSNIERLLTAWHMKIAYAFAVLIMALVGLALVTLFGSLYAVVPLGLLITFCYHGVFVLCVSAGEKGLIPPVLAAWAANIFFALLSGSRVVLGRSAHLN